MIHQRNYNVAFAFIFSVLCVNKEVGARMRNYKNEKKDVDVPNQRNLLSMDSLLSSAAYIREDADELKPFDQQPRLGVKIELELEYGEDEGDDSKKGKDKKKEDEQPLEDENRIIGGKDAPQPYPYFALLIDVTSRGAYWAGCGGALVASDFILTAAHCITWDGRIDNAYINAYSPWLGNTALKNPSTKYPKEFASVEEIFVHPKYVKSNNPPHDMALIKLSQPVQNDYFTPINLPPPVGWKNLQDNDPLTIIGFGHTLYGGDAARPKYLQEAEVNLVNQVICENSYNNVNIDSSMLCAKGVNYKIDSCNGDSGGPLIFKENGVEYLMGVTSWGYGCALEGYPGVYASTQDALPWIHETICENTEETDSTKKQYWCQKMTTTTDASTSSSAPSQSPSSAPSEFPSSTPSLSNVPSLSHVPSQSSFPPSLPTDTTPGDGVVNSSTSPSGNPTQAVQQTNSPSKPCVNVEGKFHISISVRIEHQECDWVDVSDYCSYNALYSGQVKQIKSLCPERCGCYE
uniref:Peptidase S1 domain-containing protein n=1 Tax=Eucampia antarctica TaxID=49252 RepID=A0A7S2WA50_9STRA|mmetsp:Transcript_24642/g.23667  ORF Transcript_24642/g.23667 Transcript_24642/m.23667 type:complete len:518 (+) Transcript_24642:124-1677(+)